mmetsp:Transcript_31448/g.46668  ORF Transcript_31448/g.46668 Transcript_31448/m.46668 type:complete len:233 (-) Transcript_31448:71-769(-)
MQASASPVTSITTRDLEGDAAVSQHPDRQRCDRLVQRGLARDATIKFLLENLEKMGCQPPKRFIKCVDCGNKMAGGGFGMVKEEQGACPTTLASKSFKDHLPKDGGRLLPEIYLCQNHLQDEQHARQSMVHELIHAIDMCRTKMDPLNNCLHLACTEIRAENLSGECDWKAELSRGQISSFPKHGQKCVRRRAALSVKANPNCSDNADAYLDAAMERCMNDTFPFDRHPNLR